MPRLRPSHSVPQIAPPRARGTPQVMPSTRGGIHAGPEAKRFRCRTVGNITGGGHSCPQPVPWISVFWEGNESTGFRRTGGRGLESEGRLPVKRLSRKTDYERRRDAFPQAEDLKVPRWSLRTRASLAGAAFVTLLLFTLWTSVQVVFLRQE